MPTLHLAQTGPRAFEVATPQWSIRVDMATDEGGSGTGPSPTQLIAIALAACEALTAKVWSEHRKIDLSDIRADVDYEMVDGPRRIGELRVRLANVAAKVPAELLPRLERALHACYVAATLEHPPEISVQIE